VYDRTQVQEQPHVSLEHRLRPSRRVQLVSRVSYSQFRDQYLHDQRGASALDEYQDNRESLGQLTSIASFELAEGHRTTVGMEELFQSLDSQRLTRAGQRARYSAFIQHAWLLFERADSELEIVPGFRVDSDTQFGTQPSPKIALRYKLLTHLELRASYGHGFRAPSFQEQLLRFENPSVGYIVNGNPNLKAETSRGFDASVRWFNEWLDLNTTFFRNDLHDMIAYEVLAPGDPRATGSPYMEYLYENIESAWTMGVESAAALRIRDELNCTVSYTYADTWDAETQRRIGGRARHRLSANLRTLPTPWGLDFVARAAVSWGRLYYVPDNDAPNGERPAHPGALAQVDLRVAKHFGPLIELFIGIDNVLNAGDEFAVLRPRTVYGGLRGRY
jgi:outer membrane receptor for ferrienterochelin and colicins